jgi:alanine racemase
MGLKNANFGRYDANGRIKAMKNLVRSLLKSRFPYSPVITVTINKEALRHNFNEFKKISGRAAVAPVLKSNAYGHGLVPVAQALEKEKAPMIIVDSYFEALTLRNEGITAPLLIIGYSPTATIVSNKLKNVKFTITNIDTLRDLSLSGVKDAVIHLKIDTGMNRQGITLDQIDEAMRLIKNSSRIRLEGILSHFADADNTDSSFTLGQIDKWNSCTKKFRDNFSTIDFFHLSATAGHFYTANIDANLSRLGLGLYGIRQGALVESALDIRPALEVKTVISGIKTIKKGDKVGYSTTYTASEDMVIATIPMGYFEGIDRRLSNKGFVKIGSSFAPIIGRVSMNITTVDISKIPNVKVNDEVIVISSNHLDPNSIEHIAKMCDTIPYEILVHIPQHLLRVAV